MQGQKSSVDSFREAVDIGQGSDSSGGGMNNQQSSLNSSIPPVERRWSTYVSPGEACVSASNGEIQNFVATGEASGSSSRNRGGDEGMRMEHGRSSSFGSHHAVGSMTKEILFPPRAIVSLGGHQMRNGGSFSQGSGSNHTHQTMDLNEGYGDNSGNSEQHISACREPISAASVSSDIARTSSGGSGCVMEGSDGGSGSHCSWGLSCKRKALEGTSGQSCAGAGSSSSFLQPEDCARHNSSARNNPSNTLQLSGFPNVSSAEPQDPRIGIATGVAASDVFPSTSVNAGITVRQVGTESNAVSQHESRPFNIASGGSARRPGTRLSSFGEFLDLRVRLPQSAGSSTGAPQSQSQMMYAPDFLGSNHNTPWHGASTSTVGVPNSFPFGNRGAEVGEEASLRSIPRNNVEHPIFVSVSEMRNSAHDLEGSSVASGNISTSLGIPSSTRIPSSSSNPLFPNPAWIPPHNSSAQNRQRTLEFAPWSLFPPIDPQSGSRSSHPDPLLPGPSSSRDTPMSSGRNNQNCQPPYLRSAFFADRQGEDALNISNSLRVLSADAEGRRRLISEIRQVLHAMRRSENLQEDNMLFDPFVYHGMAEMHDRHRDMRLDVDNMSYEELLALEERIGDVSTGLSEETIFKLLKHRKYQFVAVKPGPDSEPCCICQEEYVDGDDVGALDCGHDFHTDCVKQWLMHKNLCPICKTTGLRT